MTVQDPQVEQQPSNKELNFRALEAKYQRELDRVNTEKERLANKCKNGKEKKKNQNLAIRI